MNDIARPDFDNMPISTLREYASHMHIPLAKTAKKEEIKAAIVKKLNGRSSVPLAEHMGSVPPGHSKIIINEDPTPGNQQFPVYLNCNGYVCTIPRGKEVIVPARVVRTLQDAKVKRLVQSQTQDNYGREILQNKTVTVPSYPFQVLETTPGPEPLTNHEKQKQRTNGPRARYADLFGHWPRPADLRRALEKGLIKINDDEIVDLGTSAMIEEPEDNNEE